MVIRHVVTYALDAALLGVAVNVVIAVFAILVWSVYRRQLATMKAALEESRRYNQAAELATKALLEENRAHDIAVLGETRRSNASTENSNQIQRQAMVAANRAWVGIVGLSKPTPLTAGPPGLEVILRNSGHCPATNIVGRSSSALVYEQLNQAPEPAVSGPPMSIAVLFSGATSPTTLGGTGPSLSDNDIAHVKEGKLFLYYCGVFSYEDGFGSTQETRCCFYYNRDTSSWDWAHVGNRAT
jgi:hypothetical protein